MKRRNVDVGKVRRPLKRNKLTEGICASSTLVYVRFLVLWFLIILTDFILEFRFEFLWPFYLLLRTVYDSYRYQGIFFSAFFVCIALTSDVLCYFFIPIHWLFFMASTYVWVQYVWHTDRGFGLPTVMLWLLFVYLEATIRLKDTKHMPGHLDLCRPFAAHCVGYPVVTLGFGFKSYIGYRMRQRRQRDVAKENEFYQQLLLQALPADQSLTETPPILAATTTHPSPVGAPTSSTATPTTAAAAASPANLTHTPPGAAIGATVSSTTSASTPPSSAKQARQAHERNGHLANGSAIPNGVHHTKQRKCATERTSSKTTTTTNSDNNNRDHSGSRHERSKTTHTNGVAVGAGAEEVTHAHASAPADTPVVEAKVSRKREKREQDREREAAEYLQRLEADARKLRSDLQSSRQSEQELRLQVVQLTTSEKVSKGDLASLQREVEDLQIRLQSAVCAKAANQQTISTLERRVAEERRLRTSCETQLSQERKSRKQEEARAAAAQVAVQTIRLECTEACRARRRELEAELNERTTTQRWAEERIQTLEREGATLADQLHDGELLVAAITALQEKNAHLENSLSAETRIKLDLFSALGEVKRQLEIRENTNRAQEKEIEELKSKIAQVLAVMPNDSFVGGPPTPSNAMSRVRLAESPPSGATSTLDPNATAYTPKGTSLVATTEA